jgi:glycine/D-amino acid oxidase-like deaminating enzyme
MITSATRIAANGASLQADVCVVGTGPAGIALALDLSVLRLESGPIKGDKASLRAQAILNAELAAPDSPCWSAYLVDLVLELGATPVRRIGHRQLDAWLGRGDESCAPVVGKAACMR